MVSMEGWRRRLPPGSVHTFQVHPQAVPEGNLAPDQLERPRQSQVPQTTQYSLYDLRDAWQRQGHFVLPVGPSTPQSVPQRDVSPPFQAAARLHPPVLPATSNANSFEASTQRTATGPGISSSLSTSDMHLLVSALEGGRVQGLSPHQVAERMQQVSAYFILS